MPPLQLADVGLGTFVSGCLFAVAYAATGSLYTPILAHALFDLVPTAALIGGPSGAQVVGLVVFGVGYGVIALLGIVPAIRRWRARWPFPDAYIAGPLADTRALWAIATASPAEKTGHLER